MTKPKIRYDYDLGDFVGVDDAVKTRLGALFPRVDLDDEFLKMRAWLGGNRNRVGTIRFITNWLLNAKPVRDVSPSATVSATECPAYRTNKNFYADYLQELWKEAQHLLKLNTLNP